MAGLVPAIHVLLGERKKDVDARHKAGHDVENSCFIIDTGNAVRR